MFRAYRDISPGLDPHRGNKPAPHRLTGRQTEERARPCSRLLEKPGPHRLNQPAGWRRAPLMATGGPFIPREPMRRSRLPTRAAQQVEDTGQGEGGERRDRRSLGASIRPSVTRPGGRGFDLTRCQGAGRVLLFPSQRPNQCKPTRPSKLGNSAESILQPCGWGPVFEPYVKGGWPGKMLPPAPKIGRV